MSVSREWEAGKARGTLSLSCRANCSDLFTRPWRASSPWASPVVAVAMLVRSNGSPCDLSLSPLRPGRSHNTTQFSGTSSLQKTVRCTKMKIEQGISQRRSWEHREHWRERRERAYQPRGQATGGRERGSKGCTPSGARDDAGASGASIRVTRDGGREPRERAGKAQVGEGLGRGGRGWSAQWGVERVRDRGRAGEKRDLSIRRRPAQNPANPRLLLSSSLTNVRACSRCSRRRSPGTASSSFPTAGRTTATTRSGS